MKWPAEDFNDLFKIEPLPYFQMFSRLPNIEMLESRSLLAADFNVRINFAPESAPDPAGYRLDYGTIYGRHGNGLTYGWNRDIRSSAVYEPSIYSNARGDSHINMASGNSWSIAVPNGWYTVSGVAGDPNNVDGDYRMTIDGEPLLLGRPIDAAPFIEGQTTVHVTDGKLTLAGMDKAQNNKIVSLAIMATDVPEAVPQGMNIDWHTDSLHSPTERVESGVVQIGDLLYVMGGFTDAYTASTPEFDVLNIKTGQWKRLADLPGPQTHMAAATDGRYIYTAGGQTGPAYSTDVTDAVYRYDTVTDTWSLFGNLPRIALGGTMQILNGKLHYVGGDDQTLITPYADHYVLDPANPDAGWSPAAPLPTALDHLGSVVVNGDWYVLGGETEHTTSYLPSDAMYRYNAGEDQWVALPNMPTGLSHQEAGILTDGVRIYTLAGMANAQQLTGLVYSFDTRSGEWEQHTSMPGARKGGFAWLDGDRFHYLTGEEYANGLPTGGYVGQLI